MTYFYKIINSPIGQLKLVVSDKSLVGILWGKKDTRHWLTPLKEEKHHPLLLKTEQQLNDYFAGNRKKFSLPLDFKGTEFQKKVWHALMTIPFGETRSYGQIAKQIGHPKAVRAVGAANGCNPISIIAPCHRVIGANGTLTGYGGGLEKKAFLLALESKK